MSVYKQVCLLQYTHAYMCDSLKEGFILQKGNKEREDRITELEEFINDQVVELDKMEAAMKQTVVNKQLLEKDHQKLTEYYNMAKVYKM